MKEIIRPAFILFIITGIVAAVLGGVNMLTIKQIELNSMDKEKAALYDIIKNAKDFEQLPDDKAKNHDADKIYIAKSNETVEGYCVLVTTNGYGGEMTVMVGVGTDLKVKGVNILSHSETPSLGALAAEKNFLEQFTGKKDISVVKSSPKENDIVAISGATISSKAVTDAVNKAAKIAGELKVEVAE